MGKEIKAKKEEEEPLIYVAGVGDLVHDGHEKILEVIKDELNISPSEIKSISIVRKEPSKFQSKSAPDELDEDGGC